MIKPYVISAGAPVEVVNLGQTAPLGGISVGRVILLATQAMDGLALDDTARETVADAMAQDYGVFLAMLPDAPEGQVIDLLVQAATTGKANEYLIDGGSNGSAHVGYAYPAEPAAATKAQQLAANIVIAASKVTEARTAALEAFGNAQYMIQMQAGRTPRSPDDWVSDGLDWYDDSGLVSADLAEVYEDAQGRGLIP